MSIEALKSSILHRSAASIRQQMQSPPGFVVREKICDDRMLRQMWLSREKWLLLEGFQLDAPYVIEDLGNDRHKVTQYCSYRVESRGQNGMSEVAERLNNVKDPQVLWHSATEGELYDGDAPTGITVKRLSLPYSTWKKDDFFAEQGAAADADHHP